MGVPPQNLIVHAEYTGGGFGSKIVGTSNMAVPVYLAKKTGKPVMHRVTRYEENYIGPGPAGLPGLGEDRLQERRPHLTLSTGR